MREHPIVTWMRFEYLWRLVAREYRLELEWPPWRESRARYVTTKLGEIERVRASEAARRYC